MEVIINNEIRFFNDSRIRLWNKIFPIIKIWYVLFPIIYILYLIYFVNDLEDITIFIPFFHCPIILALSMAFQILSPNGNKEYIMTYYPDIAKKIYPFGGYGYNNISLLRFIDYEYIDYGVDEIIDEIIEHYEQTFFTIKMAFFGGAIFLDILGLIIVGMKH